MTKLFFVLVAGIALAGCASVRLDASIPEQAVCPATVATSKSGLVGFSIEAEATQYLAASSIPFASSPPVIEQFLVPSTLLQKANDRAQAQAIYNELFLRVPYSDDLVKRQSVSLESAAAARDLHLLLNELLPSTHGGEQLRLALSSPTANSGSTTRTLAVISTKEDVNQRLSRILQAGGDDTLVLYTVTDLTLKVSDFSVGLRDLSSEAKSARIVALQEAVANYQTARFLRTYFKAYFRGGKVFQSQLKVDEFTTKAMEAVKGQIKLDPADETALEAKLKELLTKVCTSNGDSGCLFTSLGKEKLVTRSGESLQFKGISLAIGYDTRLQATWDYPKSAELAPQLVRVFVEAVFDSMQGRPAAVANSTACSTTPPLFGVDECLASAAQPVKGGLQDVVTEVDEKASRADSLASIATGQIIRGVSVAALNNEALAKSAENFSGVLARKVVERAAWQQSGGGRCLTSEPALSVSVAKN